MPDATMVSVGKPKVTGAIHRAAIGTALPTTATEALNVGFVDLGYVSEDGVTNNGSPESETIKAWGGATVCNVQTDRPDTYKFKLIESKNKDVLGTVYGEGNVTVDGSGNITVKATADEMTPYSWVIDMILKGGIAKRIVIPNGTISELGEIVYKDNEVIGYDVTITDVLDNAGAYHYEYITAAVPSI